MESVLLTYITTKTKLFPPMDTENHRFDISFYRASIIKPNSMFGCCYLTY